MISSLHFKSLTDLMEIVRDVTGDRGSFSNAKARQVLVDSVQRGGRVGGQVMFREG